MLFWIQVFVKIALFVGALVNMAPLLLWVERKQSAMMQDRVGPNRAAIAVFGMRIRAAGLVHSIADGIKMIWKEDWEPKTGDKLLYRLAPIIALVPPLCLIAVVPVGPTLYFDHAREMFSPAWATEGTARTIPLQITNLDVGVLFVFAVAGAGIIGSALAGWASDNKFSLMGGLRAASQMVSYEVAMGLSLVGAFMVFQTVRLDEMVRWQIDHTWGIFVQPLGFILFGVSAIAETKRVPFDTPEGESEIVAGYFTEYSGLKFGMFASGELVEVCTSSAIITTIFLGGWHMPFFTDRGLEFIFSGSAAVTAEAAQQFVATHTMTPGFDPTAAGLTTASLLQHCANAFASFNGSFVWHWPHWAVVVVGLGNFVLKCVILIFLQLQIRWTLPRFRYDQIMKLGWRMLLPAALVNVLVTGVVLLYLNPPTP